MTNRKDEANVSKASSPSVLRQAATLLYHLRKLVMAIPVFAGALYLAAWNLQELYPEVGLFLQTNGDYGMIIDRGTAVVIPLFLTILCLLMMMFSKKAFYAWAISIFSLILPVLIWFSNSYPR